jgi:hypothetical protein
MVLKCDEIQPGPLGQLRERDDLLGPLVLGVMNVPMVRSCP